jgi:hypothetical protein
MKKLSIVLLLVAGLAAPAMAGEIKTFGSYGTYQTGLGGEFTLNPITGFDTGGYANGVTKNIPGFANSFQTFCVENSVPPEYIYVNADYNAVLSQNAVMGGVKAEGGDPISVGTGWLYSQFAQGNLVGYNYGANRTTSASALQQAFWWLENENGVSYDSGNIFMAAAVSQFGSQLAAQADGGWNYGVLAINMTDMTTGELRQDQLFYVPDGGATLMLLGGALVGLGALRRKFRI